MANAEASTRPHLGPSFLDDVPMTVEKLVIADKYTVIETIARGGMGVVYKARQENLDRVVAVKMLLGGVHASEDFKRRFLQEAKAVARLSHPNIVAIHDWGEDSGQPFFSMDFIAGQTLAEKAREQPMVPHAAAEMVQTLASVMQYAHDSGVIHRDLKPSNVLVDLAGVPRITDFGLARQLNQETVLTTSGQVLGTPGYLPPEQVCVTRETIGPRSDVYGLGAILYFLLTSRPPHLTSSVAEALRALAEDEPVAVRRLNRSVDPALNAICMKCLAKDPRSRYPSAAALAEDLERWKLGLAVRAGAWTIPWLRSHPWRAALRLLFAAVAVSAIAAQWLGVRIVYAEVLPRADFFNGLEPYWQGPTIVFTVLFLAMALCALFRGRRRRSFDPVLILAGIAMLFSFVVMVVFRVVANPLQASRDLPGFSGYLRFHTNGTLLASFNSGAIRSFSYDLSETAPPVEVHEVGAERFAVSPTGDRCAVKISDGAIQLLEIPSGRLVRSLSISNWPAQASSFSPDGHALATLVSSKYEKEKGGWQTATNGNLIIYSAVDGSRLSVENTPVLSGYWQALDWKSNIIAVADAYDGPRRGTLLWDVVAHRPVQLLRHPEYPSGPLSLSLSADARLLACGYAPYDVALWDVHSGKLLRTMVSQNNWVVAVEFSPDGRMVASGEGNSAVRLWDAATGKALGVFGMGRQGRSDYCYSVSFDPSGKWLACGSQRNAAVVWRVK